jgi:hypothetical protein
MYLGYSRLQSENNSRNEKMQVFHYSNKKNLLYLDPRKFGENFYTGNDLKISRFPRIFLYTERKPEQFFLNSYLYTADIEESKIVELNDFIRNNPDLKNESGFIDFDRLFETAKKQYLGIRYNNGFDIINYFYTLPVRGL